MLVCFYCVLTFFFNKSSAFILSLKSTWFPQGLVFLPKHQSGKTWAIAHTSPLSCTEKHRAQFVKSLDLFTCWSALEELPSSTSYLDLKCCCTTKNYCVLSSLIGLSGERPTDTILKIKCSCSEYTVTMLFSTDRVIDFLIPWQLHCLEPVASQQQQQQQSYCNYH